MSFQDDLKNHPGLGKNMAKWGAIGAVIAIPVPVVGPVLGAIAGAGYVWYKAKKNG